MRILRIALCLASLAGAVGCWQATEPAQNSAGPDAVDPYQVPQLDLKRSEHYVRTPADVEPFRHVKPYREYFLQQIQYTGPGRAIPEPKGVKTVKIGFIGPIAPTVSVATGGASHDQVLGNKMLKGAKLAIEQANARGGYLKRRIPFELVVVNDNGLWGASGNEIVDMAYKDKVWAILGTIDGANSHIAIRVALKAEVLMLNSGNTDPTFVETNIPWTARCIGDDRKQGYLLISTLYRTLGLKRVGIIRSSNRYGRFGVREVIDGSRRMGHPVPLVMPYEVGSKDFSLHLKRLRQANVEAIVHWGDAADGARILNQMRAMGMKHPYFACDRCVSDEFVKIAGANAEGVVCPFPWNPDRKDKKLDAFRAAFGKRFNEAPETQAAHAYDGMNMLIRAIQTAGLNRAKIRDALAHRRGPWPGVTGDIPLSAVLDDDGEVFLARRENNAWRYYSREKTGDAPLFRMPHNSSAADVSRNRGASPILIGYFGPGKGEMWQAAMLAVERANAAGGHRGRPFKLVSAWSPGPWRDGVKKLVRLVYDRRVVAIVGGPDGPSTHLAEQLVAKARLTLISPVSTDRTVSAANVPWAFSLAPGDHLTAGPLAEEIARHVSKEGPVLLSADDHDSRVFTGELTKALTKRRMGLRYRFAFKRGAKQAGPLVAKVLAARPEGVIVVADEADTARMLNALRAGGYKGKVFAKPAKAAPAAAYTYDAVQLLVAAIRKSGPDRARIRGAVAALSPWQGVAGVVRWDRLGGNTRE